MKLTNKEIKQRYFDKIYATAKIIECGCGCGKKIKSKDKYGRNKMFVNGHNNKKYDDRSQHKREWNNRNRDKRQTYKTLRIHNQKKKLIESAGGKCMVCGLLFDGECTSIFDFHHLDPTIKKFNLNNASLNKFSIAKINKEVEKCELLCANCHRLVHWDWKDNNTAGLG